MQEKLLFDLVEELAGEENGRIVPILFNKKNVNEFLIARRLELTINQVRNILYKLSNFGLVSFTRKRDNKKGWYIYYWTLNTEKSLMMIEGSLEKKANALKEELHRRETERFFVCDTCGIEVNEATSLEHGFSCEECAEIYKLADNTKIIRDTKAKITRTSNELKLIQQELLAIREKERKKRERKERKEEKIIAAEKEVKKAAKKVERDAKRALKNAEKKVAKKTVKKVVKKTKKAVKKVAKKVAKKTVAPRGVLPRSKKAAKKVAKKVAKKTVKKKISSVVKRVMKKR
ncbi:hypothetical protein HN747_02180 [archaeon]|jgi:transcription factor E|nr:hypothetical protein [archaeon]